MDKDIRIIKNLIISFGMFLLIWIVFTILDGLLNLFNGILIRGFGLLFLIALIISIFMLLSLPLVLIEQSKDRIKLESKITPNFNLEEQPEISNKIISAQVDVKKICPIFNEPIQEGAKFCVNCGNELKICEICHYYIKNNDEISICPFCKTEFHKTEFLEWLKIKAACPICKKEIDLWEFQKRDN